MNQLFIAAMLFSDFSPFASMGSAPSIFNKSVDAIKDKVSGEVVSAASNAATNAAGKAALGPLAAAGVVAGAGLLLSAAGEGVFQLTKWTRGLMGFGPISKFFQVPLGILEGVGTIFDILGAPFRYGIELIRAGFMKMFNMKDGLEKQAKNLGKFDARVRENIRRFAGVFAPVFTFFGQNETAKKLATPGSFGSLYGKKAVKDMGYSGGGKVISIKKYASGGPVNIPRTEVKEVDIPRGETTKQEPTKPGASIGGEERFAKVFPDSGGDAYKMNRYGYMINSYDTISGIPDLGSVFALTTKTLLGDIVTKDDYDRASGSLSSFMLLGLYETNPGAYQKFSSLINIKQFNRAISGFLMKSMSIPLGGIINLLKIQVGLVPKPGEDVDTTKKDGESIETGPAGSSGDKLTMARNLMRDLGLTASQAAGIVGNMAAESGVENARVQGSRPGEKGVLKIDGKTGYGIVQWTSMGRQQALADYAVSKGADLRKPLSMDIEYQFFLKEFKGKYGHVLSQIKQAQDVKTSSTIFMQQYEVPAGYKTEAKIMERYNMSKPIYDKLAAGQGKATEGLGTFIAPPPSPSANQPAGGHIVTSGMGNRSLALSPGMHMGVDISGNTGEHLKAFTDGTIEDVGRDGGYGNYVNWIDSSGVAHFYAHMNKSAFVKKGQKVKKGTVLGELGSTGRSSGPHLHWEASTNPKDTGMSKSAVLSRFNPLSRYSKESPFAGRESGGSTLTGGIRQLHKGEYVIDKDSVDLFGGTSFFSMINGVENKKQRSEKSSQLIQYLSKYTGRKIDQRPEMIVKNSDTIIIQGPPTYIESGSSRGSSGGGSSNYDEYATLDLRA
jgi:murein DD-endopeptidase MepM/ murein hydrolase activator NlpD